MIRSDMLFIDRMERRFGWLAFPGFLRYYALFQVLVFVVQIMRPDAVDFLEFDRVAILSGEVWRLITFLFINQIGGNLMFAAMFMFFKVMISFMISDALEGGWGVFKTSIFYYGGVIGLILANFIYGGGPMSGALLYASAFFAFATLFPKAEILLFFFPVQVWIMGVVFAALTLMPVLRFPQLLPYFVMALANYLIFAGIPALRGQLKVKEAGKRQRRFNAGKAPAGEPFHECAVCQRTDVSDPALEFRIGADGKEYCDDHLPPV